jgi:ADP-ribosylation factor 2-binding protein
MIYDLLLLISEDDFQRLQNSFLEKYYLEFEDSEENKFVYTDIHKEYVSIPALCCDADSISKYLNHSDFLI